MADFNADGFSAVANFFGKDAAEDDSNTKKQQQQPAKSSIGGRKHARLGLGATGESATSKQSQIGKASATKDIGKKILGVGRSKRDHAADDDNDDDDRKDDDEGDEEGRTSAVKSKAKRTFDAAALIADAQKQAKRKKKTKAGKKERAMAAEAKVAEEADQLEGEGEAKDGDCAEQSQSKEGADGDGDGDDGKKNKRKRKKVRSRQKNIRKDNRPARLKPSHLVLGNSQYGGRALTSETRAAMKLPESKTRRKAKRLLQEADGDGANELSHDDDAAISGGGGGGDIGLGLAVDDMLDDVGVAADGNGRNVTKSNGNEARKHTQKKKKKSKFKNLK